MSSEEEPLLTQSREVSCNKNPTDGSCINRDKDEIRVYSRRWYVLMAFSCFSYTQSALCDVWGVTATSSEAALGWNDANIAVIESWNYTVYVVALPIAVWCLSQYGLRIGVIISATLTLLGALLRSITVSQPSVLWLANIASICNTLAGPVSFLTAPVLSSVWFPVYQRALATSIASLLNTCGTTATFMLGPHLISSPERDVNGTLLNGAEMRSQILSLRRAELGWSALLWVVLLIYFPSKPPTPPSASASQSRTTLWVGFQSLFRGSTARFWLVGLPFGISAGLYSCWCVLLDVIFRGSLSQSDAGWAGFISLLCALFTGILIGRVADKFPHHMKLIALLLLTAAVLCMFWIVLMAESVLPTSKGMLYTSIILVGVLINSAVPLFYELACEAVYPVPESVAAAALTMLYCIFPLMMLALPLITNNSGHLMNWTMFVGLVVCAPLLAVSSERFVRLDMDQATRQPPNVADCLDVTATGSN